MSSSRWIFGATLSLLMMGCGESTSRGSLEKEPGIESHVFDDADVTRIHTRMIQAIAPDNGWERTRYLEFDWGVNRGDGALVRSHRWDRWEGLARVEAPTQDGGVYVAIFPTAEPTAGQVWVNGVEMEGDEARALLEGANRAHINDAYWLVMPFKWTDPGVNVRYLGEQRHEPSDQMWEVVELSFDAVGLTPQNMYHAWIHPETGRMERWEHFANPSATPSPSDWTDWSTIGPLTLALNRRSGGEVRLFFSHMLAAETVPEGAFAPPGNAASP